MICSKCAAVNDNEDKFCYKCGAPLAADSAGAAGAQQAGPRVTADTMATINAQTLLAARDARKSDIAGMRPLTRVAYNIVESEKGSSISSVVSIAYAAFCLGLVATLIKIFETITKLGESFTSSGIEGSLSEKFYGAASNNSAQLLIWLVALCVVLAVGFICCGKLNIRIRKVARKKKKEQYDSRL